MVRDVLDDAVSDFLRETFALIPILFATDLKLKQHLQTRLPEMKSYTKKMWFALGARSPIEYVTFTAQIGTAYMLAKPKEVLDCASYAELQGKMITWVLETLEMPLTSEELEGREALTILATEVSKSINQKLASLQTRPQ